MADRILPYAPFNFLVAIDGGRDPASILGGFAEVNGLSHEITIAEYRNGNERENHVRKVPGIHKIGDVTLKRGVINTSDFWAWIDVTRRTGPSGKRNVTITLRDEAGTPVQAWRLFNCIPMKYTGPTLNAKGGTDVAMEELVLSAEGMEIEVSG